MNSSNNLGADHAAYIMLRLPHEIKGLFREWLETHVPLKAQHVLSMVRAIRGGRENDPNYFSRMRGDGDYARMIEQRFHNGCRRYGLNQTPQPPLVTELYTAPVLPGMQQQLF